MSLALKGLNGPLKNTSHPLKPGLTLGRKGDVVVQDRKASSIHARISESAPGHWVLEDNDSKNGVRVDGARVRRFALTRGMIFYIGDQGFEVVGTGHAENETVADNKGTDSKTVVRPAEVPPAPPPAPVKSPAANPTPEIQVVVAAERISPPISPEPAPEPAPAEAPARRAPKKGRYWNEVLADFLANNIEMFSENRKPVAAFEPAVVLDFVRGTQVNFRWVLGYGPRKIGADSIDLPIWEPGAPGVCFEISPSKNGIVFKTAHPNVVLLNGQSIDNQVLRVGDTIRIQETLIEVDFIE
jgi:pSer/pThr/pTyr-binding forkhead associated (FHA) protein